MKTRKRELARVGIFGSKENPLIVNETDLQEIAETFPEIGTAPIKLGSHWAEGRPRLASVVSVEYDPKTQTLSGEVEEQDVLSDAVDQGYYPEVSIGAKARASDGKMYLHHLAYLGDEPPAVRNLYTDMAEDFHNAEKGVAASDTDTTGRLFSLPSPKAPRLYLSDTPIPEPPQPQEPSAGATAAENTNKEVPMTPEEISALQAENQRLKEEAAEKDKLLSDSAAERIKAEKAQLKKAAEGKVTVPQMEQLMELADTFASGKEIRLSDTEKTSPILALARIFESVPEKVGTGPLNLSDPAHASTEENLSAKMMGHV